MGFSRKFKFSQAALGVPEGVCGAMVLDWLVLKHSGNYNSAAALNILKALNGAKWGEYKTALMEEAHDAHVGSTWKDIINAKMPTLNPDDASATIINNIHLADKDDFDVARQLIKTHRMLVITIGNRHASHHMVGVYRTPNKYNGYHMFDPNFGEFRGSYAKAVRNWVYAILRLPLGSGGTYLTRLQRNMWIVPFS